MQSSINLNDKVDETLENCDERKRLRDIKSDIKILQDSDLEEEIKSSIIMQLVAGRENSLASLGVQLP